MAAEGEEEEKGRRRRRRRRGEEEERKGGEEERRRREGGGKSMRGGEGMSIQLKTWSRRCSSFVRRAASKGPTLFCCGVDPLGLGREPLCGMGLSGQQWEACSELE